MAALRESRAQASPTRCTLQLEELPEPTTEFSSPRRQRVFVPPPSIPKKKATRKILQAEIAEMGGDRGQELLTAKVAKKSQKARREDQFKILFALFAHFAVKSFSIWSYCAHN
jgi:hypothetical protein